MLRFGAIKRVLDIAATASTPSLSSPAVDPYAGIASVITNSGNGDKYCYISTNSTETSTTIEASGVVQQVNAGGVQYFDISGLGLTRGTTYYAHFVQVAFGNTSNVVDSSAFVWPHILTITADVRTDQNTDGTGAVTSASITPSSANDLLVVALQINTTSGNVPTSWPVTVTDSTGGTWTAQKESYSGSGSGATDGYCAIFTCPAGSTTARTITVTPNDTKAKSFKIYRVSSTSGSVGIGTTNASTWTGSQTFTAYTATQDGSKGILSFIDWVPNTLAASTDTNTVADFDNQGNAGFLSAYKVDNAISSSAVQFQITDPQATSSTSIHWAVVEFYPLLNTGFSVTLTGIQVGISQGTFTKDISASLVGQQLLTTQGTISENIDTSLTGQIVSTFQGTISPSFDVTINGQLLNTSQGTVTVSTGGTPVNINLTGIQIGTSQGSLGLGISNTLAGQQLTVSQASLALNITASLTGIGATTSQGTLTPGFSISPAGLLVNTSQGSIQSGISSILNGQLVSSSLGTLSLNVATVLSGQLITIAQGTVTASVSGVPVNVTLTGIQIGVSQGSLSTNVSSTLSGQSIGLTASNLQPNITAVLVGQGLTTGQGILILPSSAFPSYVYYTFYSPVRKRTVEYNAKTRTAFIQNKVRMVDYNTKTKTSYTQYKDRQV